MVLKKEGYGDIVDCLFEEKLTKEDFQVNTFKIIDNYYENTECKTIFLSLLKGLRDNNNKLEAIEFDYLYLDMEEEKIFKN